MLLKCFLKSQFNIDVNTQDMLALFNKLLVWGCQSVKDQRLVQIPGCQEISDKE